MSDSVRPHRQQPTRLLCPWDSLSKNTGVGCHFLLQLNIYHLFIIYLFIIYHLPLSCLYHLYLSFIIYLYHIYPQEDPLEKEWLPTPVYLPGKSHGERSLASCSSWVAKSWTWTHLKQLSIISYISSIYYLSINCLWACPVRSVEDFTVKHLEAKGS